MKKTLFLLLPILLLSIAVSAQTQQGYVKTKGRMVDGKHVPGQGLKGATVSIKGRTAVVVNANDGAFSFPIPESQFRVDSVRKKGYQLVDMDAVAKIYRYSANPIYLVMETPEQQWEDQLSAERKIRRTLTNQLHQREDEIEALKEQQKISDEEYRQALQKLYEETDQNDQLVKDMVERYSKIDYDQLSEFDQKISEFILNGELIKADSMLRTKGDINQRVEEYRKHQAVNAKEKEELSQRQEQLEQSEALAIQERDDLANDCYRKFEIHKMKHESAEAAYYIILRANLDTLNTSWQLDAGEFIAKEISPLFSSKVGGMLAIYNKIEIQKLKHLNSNPTIDYSVYFSRATSLYTNTVDKAYIYSLWGLADLINDNPNHKTRIDSCLSALVEKDSIESLYTYKTYLNIGHYFSNCSDEDYNTALQFETKALSIAKRLFNNDEVKYYENYWKIGVCYFAMNNPELAIENCEHAMNIMINHYGEYDGKLWWYYYSISEYLKNIDSQKHSVYAEKASVITNKELDSIRKKLEEYEKLCSEEVKKQAPKFGL